MAKARRKGSVKLLGVMRRPRPALLVSTALCATVAVVVSLPARAQPASNALPTGGSVFGGSASISTSGNQTTINQASQRAAINWQTFNIGSQAQVQFNQPNAAAVALNRVTTPNPSQIAGKLNANGQVIIENQSGVVFYKGSQVNTAGLMVTAASSSDAATQAFLNGGKLVTDLAANPNAAVINQGQITVKQAGLAALVAPQVRNDGVIVARLGHVVLASGTQTTLDLYGDGLMSIDVTGLVTTLPNGATALVTNTGIIVADGGTVQLTARVADSIVQTLVDAGGKIRANTVGGHTGTIRLAGVGGSITIEGQLQADGARPGTVGGNIVANPSGNVNLASTARISASGQAGGGVIALGTTLKRAKGGPGVTATRTSAGVYVASGAQIAANATQKGDGGHVAVLSTGTTVINGTISATGGPQGGNGGFVETSGNTLGMTTGSVDVAAPMGSAGTWLLDPTNLYIVSSGGDQDSNFTGGNGTITTAGSDTANDQLSATVLNGASGNVLLQASHTIEVESSFSIPAGSLTMEAGQLIQIDQNVVVGASSDIILGAGGAGPGTPPTGVAGSVINVNGSLISSGGNISLLDGPGGNGISIGISGLVQATSGKTVTMQTDTIAVGGSVVATSGTIEIAPATSGNAINFASSNSGTLQIPTTSLGKMSASVLRLGAVTLNGTLTTTAGSINFDTNVNLGGVASTLDLHATGDVARTANTIVLSVATLTGSISGNLLLAGGVTTGDIISTVGSFSVGPGDEFQILTSGGVTIAGPISAGDFYVADVSGANITVPGSVNATNSAILSGVGGTIAISGIVNTPNLTIGTFGTITMTGTAPTIGQAGGTLALGASGGMFEGSTGAILAGTIIPVAGIGLGTISLLGTSNTVSNLGSLNASGDFLLATKSALTVGNTLATTGSIYLQSGNAGGITIASTGSVVPGSAKLASFQADAFTNNGTVIAAGGTVEVAPNTTGAAVSLGTGGSLPSLGGITASLVRIGAVTGPAGGTLATTAGSIAIVSAFGSNSVALELDSLGSISGSGGALTASTLTGSAGGDAAFTATNTIATLGNFADAGHNFILNDSGSLAVTGSISAANATISSGTIGVNGGSIVTPGSIGLTSTSGAIAMTGTALLNGGTVGLTSNTSITEAATSTIIASTLSAVASGGSIQLSSPLNAIAQVTGASAPGNNITIVSDPNMLLTGSYGGADLLFVVTGSTDILQIGSAGAGASLNATGTISLLADTITESASTLIAGGAVEVAPSTGTVVTLNGTQGAGGLVIDSTLVSEINAPLLRVGEANGTITATDISLASSLNTGTIALELDTTGSVVASGTNALTVPTLSGTAGTGFTLIASGDSIGTLGLLSTGSGDILVTDAAPLTVEGLVTASSGNIEVQEAPGVALTFGGGSLVVGGNGTIGVVTDALTFNSGAISTGSGGLVEIAPTTSGQAVALGATSSTGTLGITGAALADISTGTLRIGGYHDRINNGGSFTISAGTIAIDSSLNLGPIAPVLDLDSTAGIAQGTADFLDVATLTGTVTSGSVALIASNNDIGTLGAFTVSVGTLSLTDTSAPLLGVTGPVIATGISLVAGPVEIEGAVSATSSGTIAINATGGSSTVSIASGGLNTGGVVDLSAQQGISESGGTINAGILQSSSGVPSGAVSLSSANNVGTLANFAVGGTFYLNDTGGNTGLAVPATVTGSTGVTLAIATGTLGITGSIASNLGTVSLLGTSAASTIALTGSAIVTGPTVVLNGGTIALNGSSSLGSSSGLVDLSASSGGVNEASTATIVAATLQSSGSVTGGATLAGSHNNIATLGNFIVPIGNFNLNDPIATNLAVNGSVSAGGVTITGPGTINVASGITSTTGTLLLNGGSIVIATGGVLNDGSGAVDLSTTAGGITETGGSIIAAVLQSSSNAAGSVALTSNNSVASIGNFAVTGTGDSFSLTDAANQNLGVAGTLSAPTNVALATSGTGTITATGSINAGTSLAIAAGSGGIALNGSAVVTGPTITLNGGGGTIALNGSVQLGQSNALVNLNTASAITEASTAQIIAATLQSSGSVTGTVSLVGTSNAIANLGNFPVGGSGNFYLMDASALSVSGVLSVAASSGKIFLESSNSGGITIANGGTVSAPNGEASFQANAFAIASGGSVATGSYVGLAPDTNNTAMSLGTAVGGELSLVSLSGISTGNLLAGGVTTPTNTFGTGTARASNITIGGIFDTTGLGVLSFYTTTGGAVTQTQPIIGGAQLAGVAGGFTLLNPNNAISGISLNASGNIEVLDASALTLGPGGSSGGNIYAASSNASGITLNGAVSAAGTIGVQADALTITSGTISAPTVELAPFHSGTLVTLGGSGGLSLANLSNISTSLLRVGAISIPGTAGPTTTAGSIVIADAFGSSTVALELDSLGGITGSGVLTASALTGTADGAVTLNGNNVVATLGSFTATGSFALAEASTTSLIINGPVSATSEAITGAGTTTIDSTITATSGALLINGGSIVIGTSGTAGVLSDPTGAVDLSTTGGGVTEASTGVINAATLLSSGGVTGSGTVSLGGINHVGTLGNFLVSSSSLFVADGSNALTVAGSVNATGVTLTAGTIAVNNTIVTAGDMVLVGTTGIGIGSALLNGGTVDVSAPNGSVVESSAGTIIAGTLLSSSGVANGATFLVAANTIGALGSFDVTNGNFLLNDPGVSGTLAVIGLVAGAIVDLSTANAGIRESGAGAIDAATLQSSLGAGGNVELGGTNAVGTLANFVISNGTYHLTNSGSLSGLNVTGSVIASSVTLDGLSGTLSITSTVSATAAGGLVSLTDTGTNGNIALNNGAVVSGPTIDLKSGSIALLGTALLGNSTALLDLTTTSGGVTESSTATILAGTLQSSGSIANSASLGSTNNTIAAIGSLAVSGGTFSLTDNGNLSVGTLTAPSIGIADNNGTLTVAHSLIATNAVNLSATTIVIPGEVSDGGSGTTSLIANGGSIVETGTLIAGILSGSASAAANLAGVVNGSVIANQVGMLGNFSAASFVLNSGNALTVVGTVNGGSSVAIDDTQALTVTGSVISANLMNLTGSAIAITGSAFVSDGGSGTTDLIATIGTIFENATLIAGILAGSAAAGANLAGVVNGAAFANHIGTLSNFSATSLVLNSGTALAVVGTVNGGSSVAIDASQSLSIIGSVISSNLMSLTGSTIAITGTALVSDGGSGTTDLAATAGTIYENATILVGTLNGTATASASFLGNNTIANVGSFGANGFVLNDGTTALNIGTLIGGTLASVDVTGTLTIASLVSASAVDLTATTILIPGMVNATASGAVDLVANGGSISETGALVANTLSGTATGVANLLGATATTNQVGTVVSFTSNGFALDDGTNLTIDTVTGSSFATVIDGGTLSVTGILSASTIGLTAGAIAIPGEATAGIAGTIYLAGTTGAILETGTLIAGTLSGTAAAEADLAGATASTNQIANVGSFRAAAGFVLNDGASLSVGAVSGNTFASIDVAGTLTVNTLVSAGVINLTATTITVPGTVTAGATGTAGLFANSGPITETGLLIAGTLAGSATGTADLANATIGTLGSFSAAVFTLNDSTSLTVAAPVVATAGSVTIADTGSLTNNGTIQAATAATVSATASATNTGSVIGSGGDVLLAANGGTLSSAGLIYSGGNTTLQSKGGMTLGGVVNATGSTTLNSGGAINQNGSLIAAALTGSAASVVNLLGATPFANQVATLAGFSAGGFTMNDGEALTVNGPVTSASGVTIADAAALSVNGNIVSAAAVSLTGSSIGIGGYVTDGGAGTTSLTATGGAITETGTLIAGTLSGSATGVASLTGATASTNQIANLSNFSASSVTLQDGASLTVVAPVTATTGAIAITTQGALANNAPIQAATNATVTAATAVTNNGSIVAQNGSTSITAATGKLENRGLIQASANAMLTGSAGLLNSGAIIAQTGNASLTAATGTLFNSGLMSAAGTLSLTASNGAIVQSGAGASMVAGAEVITNASGSISLDGLVKDDTGVVLNSGGNISQDGILIADLLTGSAAGTVNLLGASTNSNQVTTLGSFTANGGVFALNDGISLTIAGPVTVNGASGSLSLFDNANVTIAGPVSVTGAGGSFVLNNNGSVTINNIVTAATLKITTPGTIFLGTGGFVTGGVPDGTPVPNAPLSMNALPFIGSAPYMGISQGAWLRASGVVQTGSVFTVANFNGTAESVLLVDFTPSSVAGILHLTDGLEAPNTWAIFNVGSGQSSGAFNVQRLDFIYNQAVGTASFLNSTINGVTGDAAAGAGFIQPGPQPNFRIDGCPIHAVNCVIVATQRLPEASPISDLVIGAPGNAQDQEDLVLPVVSDERYELLPCASPNAQGACDPGTRPTR